MQAIAEHRLRVTQGLLMQNSSPLDWECQRVATHKLEIRRTMRIHGQL